jgi:hypothetical protein
MKRGSDLPGFDSSRCREGQKHTEGRCQGAEENYVAVFIMHQTFQARYDVVCVFIASITPLPPEFIHLLHVLHLDWRI